MGVIAGAVSTRGPPTGCSCPDDDALLTGATWPAAALDTSHSTGERKVKQHPVDERFLDTLPWREGQCACCQVRDRKVTEVDYVEEESGPGWSVMFCRPCVAYILMLERNVAVAGGHPYSPALPAMR
jgi:hypothetical protein